MLLPLDLSIIRRRHCVAFLGVCRAKNRRGNRLPARDRVGQLEEQVLIA